MTCPLCSVAPVSNYLLGRHMFEAHEFEMTTRSKDPRDPVYYMPTGDRSKVGLLFRDARNEFFQAMSR